jgi:hypothetical protein
VADGPCAKELRGVRGGVHVAQAGVEVLLAGVQPEVVPREPGLGRADQEGQMRVEDENLLDEFRQGGPCELCGRHFAAREPHHAFCRGMGGGTRADVRWNLVAVGPSGPGGCGCHDAAQSYRLPRRCVLAVIACREGLSIEEVERRVYELRRAPKKPR